jgi:hypothetical protein
MLLVLVTALLAPPLATAPADRPRPPAVHQDRDDDDEEVSRRAPPDSAIVVTGRGLDAARTHIDEALGASVYALDNEAVEHRPGGETGSLASILAQAPGVGNSTGSPTIRGSRAIQIRINDVIVPEAIPDAAEHLSARLAETTRLIAGTLPAQFGFAPGGVISVTTKSGLYQSGGQIELFADTGGMVEPAAEWAGSLAGTSLFGSGSFERGRNRVAGSSGRPARERRQAAEGLAFADHLIGTSDRVSLILGGALEHRDIGDTGIGAGIARRADAFAIGTYLHSGGDFTLQASIFLATAREEARFAAFERVRQGSAGTQIDATLDAGPANVLRAGLLLDHRVERGRDGGASAHAARSALGAYVQDEWKLGPALAFNPGLRAEWLRGVSSAASWEPRASLVWSLPSGLTAHVGYARYATAPPLESSGGAALLPDETDDYFDGGIQRHSGPLTLGLDLYWRRARNLLAQRELPGRAAPAAFGFRRARFRGVEFSAAYARGPVTAWANLSLSAARARDIFGGSALFGPTTLAAARGRWLALASDRPAAVSAGATWRLGRLDLSADLLAGSGSVRTLRLDAPNGARAPAYATLALAAVHHLRVGGHSIDIRADLTNLADVRQPLSDAANLEGGWTRFTPGRALLVGIEAGF